MLHITLIIRAILRDLGAIRPIFQNIAYFYPCLWPKQSILILEVHYIKYDCIPRNLEIYNYRHIKSDEFSSLLGSFCSVKSKKCFFDRRLWT